MKLVVKILLALAVVMLTYLCVMSIMTPINFEADKAKREKDVVAALINIRKAQTEYKTEYGKYTDNFDSLIAYVKTGKVKMLKKEGTLTDEQLEKGLTEDKAIAIVKSGDAKAIAANGLQGFKREVNYVSVLEYLFAGVYDASTIDQLRYIPHTDNVQFEMATNELEKNGIKIPLLEVKADCKTYLGDLDKQELINFIDIQTQLNKYPGLKIGSTSESNNNAGNWEF